MIFLKQLVLGALLFALGMAIFIGNVSQADRLSRKEIVVRNQVIKYINAFKNRDAKTICELMIPQRRKAIIQETELNCIQFETKFLATPYVRETFKETADPANIEVALFRNQAAVRFKEDPLVEPIIFLKRIQGKWYVINRNESSLVYPNV